MVIRLLAATSAVLFLSACSAGATDDAAAAAADEATSVEGAEASASATGALKLPSSGGPAVFWTMQAEGIANTFVLNVHLGDARLQLTRNSSMRPQPGTYPIVVKNPAAGDFELVYAPGSQAIIAAFEQGTVTITESTADRVVGTLTAAGTLFERNDPANMMAGATDKGPFSVEAAITAPVPRRTSPFQSSVALREKMAIRRCLLRRSGAPSVVVGSVLDGAAVGLRLRHGDGPAGLGGGREAHLPRRGRDHRQPDDAARQTTPRVA